MLRGIATLKMFGRSAEQVDNMRTISRQYGETTLEVLRSAFQTGLVLDWAGAVAMALVAVEVSLRLMAGSMPFERALAVLVITPGVLPAAARRSRSATTRGRPGRRPPSGCSRSSTSRWRPIRRRRRVRLRRGRCLARGPATRRRSASTGSRTAIPVAPGRRVAGLSLTIPAGARVAIVGPTGAGKSTIVGLLLRFLEPDDGTIRVGSTDLAAFDAADWRSTVAWVPQSPHLFHGTVADNLRLARPDASDADLHAAVTLAALGDVIDDLPAGLETPDRRGRLPAERRRAPAAGDRPGAAPRRVGRRPRRADRPPRPGASRSTIDAAIGGLAGSRTVIVISHRPRLARSSDLVAVIDGGRLVELGPPADLLDAGGAFAALDAAWPDDTARLIEAPA